MTDFADTFAFPVSTIDGYTHNGMTKREMFAMVAMQGLLSKEGMEVSLHTEEGVLIVPASKGIPMLAVRYADRLLAELEKSE